MNKATKTGYAIGLAILGFILYLTIHQTIGLALLIIGLVSFVLFSFLPGKKKEQSEAHSFEQEKPVSEGEIAENTNDENNESNEDYQ
jgi:cbb3-type cytochrome oxidase subunit 3